MMTPSLDPQVENTSKEPGLACLAIHSCRVDTLSELRVSACFPPVVLTCDAPLPSAGSRWPRFPVFVSTMRALRLPAPACPSAY